MSRSEQSNEEIEQHVRLVGLVTLRRLRKMADAEIAAESRNAMWTKRSIIALIALMVLLVGGLWLHQII